MAACHLQEWPLGFVPDTSAEATSLESRVRHPIILAFASWSVNPRALILAESYAPSISYVKNRYVMAHQTRCMAQISTQQPGPLCYDEIVDSRQTGEVTHGIEAVCFPSARGADHCRDPHFLVEAKP
jgi:hypothetical protein